MNSRVVAIAGISVAIISIGGWWYWPSGDPPGGGDVRPGSSGHDAWLAVDAALSERLKKLEQTPGDGVGWALLARSYAEAGRHPEAVPIYERAMKLIPDDPQLLADFADSLGMLQGRRLEGRPQQLIQRALTIDPSRVKALMLAGTMAFDRKEFAQAVKYWERAGANLPAEGAGALRQELLANIAEANGLAGGISTEVKASTVPTPNTVGGEAVAITGTVTIASELAGKGSPADTLFVFARRVSGPPMPVAIVRAAKRDVPFTFRLDDSNSPMPARKLSEAGDVMIVARLSKSGEAMPGSGDLEGISRAVRVGAEKVTVVINRELP